MSILSDWEIKALSLGNELISPFIDKVVSEKGFVFLFFTLSEPFLVGTTAVILLIMYYKNYFVLCVLLCVLDAKGHILDL